MSCWISFSFVRVLCGSWATATGKTYAKRFIVKHYLLLNSCSFGVSNIIKINQCWDLYWEPHGIQKHQCMLASIPPQQTLVADGWRAHPKEQDSDRPSPICVSTSRTPLVAGLLSMRQLIGKVKQEQQSFSLWYLVLSSLRARLEALWTWQKHSHWGFQ